MPTVLMVIAPDQFRDEEYSHPKEVLERLGAKVVTASVAPGPCRGRFGLLAQADVALMEVDAEDYDAVVFVGGAGANIYFDDADARRLATQAEEEGKIVAAICIAPTILGRSGLLSGKRVTSFPSQEDELRSQAGEWTGRPVEVDGRIITANGPDAAKDFGLAVAHAIGISGGESEAAAVSGETHEHYEP